MSVWSKIASLGIGETLKGVGELAKDIRASFTGEEVLSEEKKVQIETMLTRLESQAIAAQAGLNEVRGEIIVAEAQGESWLQRNWRPLLMCAFGTIVVNNYILAPYLSALFGFSVILEIPPSMWELLKIGIGGYIVGRSTEKAIDRWKK